MALRLPKQDYRDIERVIELDFVRATEAAALNSLRWLGRGDKKAADAAASDAIRGMFDLMNICGEVVIGEGIKDEAPGIFKGEQLGTWYPGSPEFHIAIDPIDGTTNISKGAPNSISCIAAARPGRRESGVARHPFVLHVEAGVWGARDRIHEETRGFASTRHADCRNAGNCCARGGQARAGCGGDDAGSAASQGNRGTDSRGRRIVADDRRWRH